MILGKSLMICYLLIANLFEVYFPLLYFLRKKWYILLLIALYTHIYGDGIPYFRACWPFQLVFIAGIIMASYKTIIFSKTKTKICIILFCLLVSSIFRIRESVIVTWQDVFMCYFIVSLYANIEIPKIIGGILYFLGLHSFNIFLFHTFINRLYFSEFIYS